MSVRTGGGHMFSSENTVLVLPGVRFSCLGRDQIFTSRYVFIRDKQGRDNESQLYL